MSDGKRPLAPGQYYAQDHPAPGHRAHAPTAAGKLYDVDMRLRPSGASGPVAAVSADGFETYHRDEAWTWERMAMTRARTIAGDEALAARVKFILTATLSAARDPTRCARTLPTCAP